MAMLVTVVVVVTLLLMALPSKWQEQQWPNKASRRTWGTLASGSSSPWCSPWTSWKWRFKIFSMIILIRTWCHKTKRQWEVQQCQSKGLLCQCGHSATVVVMIVTLPMVTHFKGNLKHKWSRWETTRDATQESEKTAKNKFLSSLETSLIENNTSSLEKHTATYINIQQDRKKASENICVLSQSTNHHRKQQIFENQHQRHHHINSSVGRSYVTK